MSPQIKVLKVADEPETSEVESTTKSADKETTTKVSDVETTTKTSNIETTTKVSDVETTSSDIPSVTDIEQPTTKFDSNVNPGNSGNNGFSSKETTKANESPKQTVASSNNSSNEVVKPKATKISRIKTAKKSITITWNKVKNVKGYEIQVATNKKFKKNTKKVLLKNKNISQTTIKKLKSKKKYFIRIRTYNYINGKISYSKWINVKSAKTK